MDKATIFKSLNFESGVYLLFAKQKAINTAKKRSESTNSGSSLANLPFSSNEINVIQVIDPDKKTNTFLK